MGKINDSEASKISLSTYERDLEKIVVEQLNEKDVIYNVIDTIEDKFTGLHGYVLKDEITNEIVISFEGTQKNNGFIQGFNDVREDINGILLGHSYYTEEDYLFGTNINQFTEADPVVNQYIEEYGAENITFVGHSLGGALAEYFAVKHDSHAVSFAAPDIYNLLTKEEKKMVDNGDFKDNIISYAYPDDIVSWYDNNSIGSTYFLDHPGEADFVKWFNNHSIKNYTNNEMFDEDGYFIPELLYDETLFNHPEKSPLALKNSGVENFNIVIKAFIMKLFALEVENNAELVENTEKAFGMFLEYYEEVMSDMKSKYNGLVGSGGYDLLSSADVDDVFTGLGKVENGIPIIFNIQQYEEILKALGELQTDTQEVAFHMTQMGDEFEKTDTLLAQWLEY